MSTNCLVSLVGMGTYLTCVKAAGGSIRASPKRDSGNLTESESVFARAFCLDWRGDRALAYGLTNALSAADQVGAEGGVGSGGMAVIQVLGDHLALAAFVTLQHLIGDCLLLCFA